MADKTKMKSINFVWDSVGCNCWNRKAVAHCVNILWWLGKEHVQKTLNLFWNVIGLLSFGHIKLEVLILSQILVFTIQLSSATSSQNSNQKSSTDFNGVMTMQLWIRPLVCFNSAASCFSCKCQKIESLLFTEAAVSYSCSSIYITKLKDFILAHLFCPHFLWNANISCI